MRFTSEDIARRILYKDEATLVLNKPAGIAVHAGPKGGVTLDEFLPALRFGKQENPQLAHRLDKETTGCLVLGRDKASLKRLGAAFQRGTIEKTYCAIVCGIPLEASGRITFPLARRSHDKRSWWMKTAQAGEAGAEKAATRYRVLAKGEGMAFLALAPETGRTHQLRVHCAAMGWPIAGDRIYGGDRAQAASNQLHLHAARIILPGKIMVEAPLPLAMQEFLSLTRMETVLSLPLPNPV